MALATSTIVGLGLAAASAAGSYYNTQNTAKKQDNAAASAIRSQSAKQREADAKVGDTVAELEASTSANARKERLGQYMETLRTNKGGMEGNLTGSIGGDAFKADSAAAAGDVQQYAGKSADLMARMDAPEMQRQGEAFGYGKLGTDINLIGRESRGQAFMDELRMRGIRRNPWIDAGSALAGGVAGAYGGGASTAQATQAANGVGSTFFANGGLQGVGL